MYSNALADNKKESNSKFWSVLIFHELIKRNISKKYWFVVGMISTETKKKQNEVIK